jgi:hypothetical protein
MLNNSKARQANDMTIGEAENLHALALKMKADAKGYEVAVWATLIGTPRRTVERLQALYKVSTLRDLADSICMLEAPHA